jgi:hypothetical protein
MRLLKTIITLLAVGSVPLAGQDVQVRSSRLAAAGVIKELKESSGLSNSLAEPESPFIDLSLPKTRTKLLPLNL